VLGRVSFFTQQPNFLQSDHRRRLALSLSLLGTTMMMMMMMMMVMMMMVKMMQDHQIVLFDDFLRFSS
jgi:hypothetical protein